MSPAQTRRWGALSQKLRAAKVKTGPSADDAHDIVYFKRHLENDPAQSVPAREALSSFPAEVRASMRAVLIAVAKAPPGRFAGGGNWEAMHGAMSGWFEVRAEDSGRHHYRLYCQFDHTPGASYDGRPLLVVITGYRLPPASTRAVAHHPAVMALGDEYLARLPRSLT